MAVTEPTVGRSSSPVRILVVEDDESTLDFYRYFFQDPARREYGWCWAISGERALQTLKDSRNGTFDLVVLDWGLPRMSGMDFLEHLRRDPANGSLPVIMVSSRGDAEDKVAALDAGADDYLSKPFDLAELDARLRCVLRRSSAQRGADGSIRLDDLELEAPTHALRAGSISTYLSPIEFALMAHFVRRPNMIHSAAFLWDSFWGNANPNRANVLQVTICKLRKKLGPKWGPRLESHRGRGYLLNSTGR